MAEHTIPGGAAGTPVIILKDGSTQSRGRDAQKNNLLASKLVVDIVKSSLGPRGRDKMLVDSLGDVTITNDGATMLKELDVQHPAAKMLVEVSKTTDSEVGDGTTSAVVLAGSLLAKAEELLDKEVHPTLIVDGYLRASEKALELLDKISVKVSADDKDSLNKVAVTSMLTKLVADDSEELASLIVDALLEVATSDNGFNVDLDNVKVEKKPGGSIADTSLIKGLILDKEVVHSGMPKLVNNAKIAIVSSPLEIEKTEMSAEIRIDDPGQMKMFMDEENNILSSMVDKVSSVGANVLVCQKGIDDVAQHYLAKAGIAAVRRAKESDMTKLAKATGGLIVNNIDDLASADLGKASLVEERIVEEDKWVFVEGCKNPKAVSLLIRGGSQRVIDEADRSVHDAIMVVKDVIESPAIVAGGGAPEFEISHKIREWATTLSGREQLAVQQFADALESIPLTLAENAGMDAIDAQVDLRNRHSEGKTWWGVDVNEGKVSDLFKKDIIEPLKVKEQIIKSATEAAAMILRIDDVIASGKMKTPPMGGHGGEEM